MPSETAPPEVVALATARADARAARDFAAADRLRDEIADAGWLVTDSASGPVLTPKPPYDVLADLRGLPDRSAEADTHRATVSVVVDGWPDDVRTCLDALLAHTADDVVVQVLDLGNADGAGEVVHAFAGERVQQWHVAGAAAWRGGSVGWADARRAVLRADTARLHVWCDLSTVLTGDALTPLLDAIDASDDVVASGWRGVNVDVADEWRSFVDAGPGDVDAVLGYLMAMRRSVAL
ncbi:MAG: glycosyltransferase family 2 protein, partial [Frankiaceae bacterium]|nr:glycosyltransferase family 2 protein [Frankiaceae bacterium]